MAGIQTPDGLLLVDKPPRLTSHDVTAVVRRALGTSRIGHSGTLDPAATGLLLLLIGRATRLLPYLNAEPKEYRAAIRFGSSTATDDAAGDVTGTGRIPEPNVVLDAIASLTGELQQVPPSYSAKQQDGMRAYRAARRGRPMELPPVRVTVHGWDDVRYDDGLLTATITCGGGTYIRSLARDLGLACSSAAHLADLRRIRMGEFSVSDALSLDDIADGRVSLRPAVDAVSGLPHVPLSAEEVEMVAHGRCVPVRDASIPSHAALVDEKGALVAVAAESAEGWQPRVVFADA
jgi:tRNA pseudouridine55 synthase